MGSAARMNSSPSSSWTPESSSVSAAMRTAIAQSSPISASHPLDRLEPEPAAVLERAAVGVGAAVEDRREELGRQVGVRAVDVEDVEARRAGPPGGGDPLVLDAADVGRLHHLGHGHAVPVACDLRRRKRRQARLALLGEEAAVPELDAGQRAVLVGRVGHERERAHVLVVPEAGRGVGLLVGLGADRAVLGAHRRPAALGLHAAKRGLRPRLLDAEPGAVRHLVEAVSQRAWARSGPARRGCRGGPGARALLRLDLGLAPRRCTRPAPRRPPGRSRGPRSSRAAASTRPWPPGRRSTEPRFSQVT